MEMSFEHSGIYIRSTMDSIGRMVSYETAENLLKKYPCRYDVFYFGIKKPSEWVNLHLLGTADDE